MQKRGRYGLLYSYILVPECKRFIKTFLNSFWGLKKSRLYTYVNVCELYYSNPTSSVFFLRCAFVSWIQECQNPEKKVFCSVIFQDFVPSDFKAHISRECCLGFLWAFPFVDSTILKVLVFVDYVIKPS